VSATAYTIEEEFAYNPDQERADDGKFGSGGGSGGASRLPKNDSHVSKLPAPATKNSEDPHNQVKWAGEKAKEAQRPIFLAPNTKTGPGQGPHSLAYKAPKSGDYHAVHPDGRITFHPGAPTKAKGKAVTSIGFARSCEAFAAGEAPHSIRLWRAGWNVTDKGNVNFTPRSAQLVMADYARRGNPLVFDYEHESLLPLEKRGGSPMKGVASATSAEPFCPLDANGQPELWTRNVEWTPEAKRQIGPAGERRQISPVCDFDTETGEVLNLKNVALCREGATHAGTLLASVAKGTSTMDELIQAICDAAAAQDFEKVEALCAQAEGAGSPGIAKMGRAMAKPAAPPVASPPPAAAPPVAMAKPAPEAIAASRDELEAVRREGRTYRVQSLIAASRGCFDAADEREHIALADPGATERHIASVTRKMGVGTLAATRATTDARPPKDDKDADPTCGLSVVEIQVAGQHAIPLKDFAARKAVNQAAGRARGKVS